MHGDVVKDSISIMEIELSFNWIYLKKIEKYKGN